MIPDLLTNFFKEHLAIHALLIFIATAAMLVAMLIDLIAGIRKARERGVARTSRGLKRTARKAGKYFSPYFVLVCIDCIASCVIPFPVFALMWAAYCIFCEFKSVREKAWDKAEIEKAEKTVSVIIENKDDIVKLASQIIFNHNKSGETQKVKEEINTNGEYTQKE